MVAYEYNKLSYYTLMFSCRKSVTSANMVMADNGKTGKQRDGMNVEDERTFISIHTHTHRAHEAHSRKMFALTKNEDEVE